MDDKRGFEIVSDRVHVAYYARTGVLAHAHRIVTCKGGKETSHEAGDRIALAMAGRHGHDKEKLRVLRVDTCEPGPHLRVDVKTGKLVSSEKPARPARRSRVKKKRR
jgi:hypothetical protein